MKLHVLLAALAASTPLVTLAGGPDDAAAPVPPTSYRSAFEGLSRGVEEGSVDWKAANAEVGRFPRGHADLLKWEQSQRAAGTPAAALAASAPASPPASVPGSHGHRH